MVMKSSPEEGNVGMVITIVLEVTVRDKLAEKIRGVGKGPGSHGFSDARERFQKGSISRKKIRQ